MLNNYIHSTEGKIITGLVIHVMSSSSYYHEDTVHFIHLED